MITFWGHTGNTFESFLSQWKETPFTDGEFTYPTAEHYMMYHKALLFNDKYRASIILNTDSPKKAKALGREIINFDSAVWNLFKQNIVFKGNLLKFFSSKYLKNILLHTDNALLVEASPYDRIWGVGYKAEDLPEDKSLWGQNLLGVALMNVRSALYFNKREEIL